MGGPEKPGFVTGRPPDDAPLSGLELCQWLQRALGVQGGVSRVVVVADVEDVARVYVERPLTRDEGGLVSGLGLLGKRPVVEEVGAVDADGCVTVKREV
jgi:hypothetical protein